MSCKNKNLFKVASILLIGAFSFGLSVSCVNAHGKETIKVSAEESDGKWTLSDGSLSFQYTEWQTNGYVTETNQIMVYGHGDGTFDISYELLGSPPGATSAGTEYIADKTIQLIDGYWTPSETGGYGTVSGYPVGVNGLDSGTMITLNITVQYSGDMNEQNSGAGTTEPDGKWTLSDGSLSFQYTEWQTNGYVTETNQIMVYGHGDGTFDISYELLGSPPGATSAGTEYIADKTIQLTGGYWTPSETGGYGTVSGYPVDVNGLDSGTMITLNITVQYSGDMNEQNSGTGTTESNGWHYADEQLWYYSSGYGTGTSFYYNQPGEYAVSPNQANFTNVDGSLEAYIYFDFLDPQGAPMSGDFEPLKLVSAGFSLNDDDNTYTVSGNLELFDLQPFTFDNVSTISGDIDEPTTVECSYTITYYPNGADGEPANDSTDLVPEGDTAEYMLLHNMFERPNYIFLGWSTDSSSQNPNYEEGEKVYLRSDISYYAVWEYQEPEYYTRDICFDPANGEEFINRVAEGETLPLSYEIPDDITPTYEGHTFNGWYYDGNLYQPGEVISNITENITLVAQWEAVTQEIRYTITYYPNGAVGDTFEGYTEYTSGDSSEVSYTFERCPDDYYMEGYSFVGWSTSQGGEEAEYKAGEPYTVNSDLHVYAVWVLEEQEPEVTSLVLLENPPSYYYVGDVIDFQNIILVANYSDGTTRELTSNDYVAYFEPDGDPYGALVSGDYMLYFTYEGVTTERVPIYVNEREPETYEFEIIFVANDGTSVTRTNSFTHYESSYTYDDLPSIEQIGFTREGYSFVGWSYSSDGEVLNEVPVIESGTTRFYAIWQLVGPRYQYTVTFDGNGATSGSTDPVILSGDDYSQTIVFPECGYEREGYIFKGWGFNSEAVIIFQPGEERTDITSDTTVYAIWTQVFTISFDANGGEGMMENITIPEGNASMPECAFTREGYSFAGWAVGSPTGDVYPAGASVYVSANYVLYATWESTSPQETEYTVRFNGNGATSGSMDDDSFTSSQEYSYPYILPECGFERDGYIFAGWGTTETALIKRQPGETIDIQPGETTFYAIWTQVFTISFDANGGEGTMENITIPEGNATMPECDFTKEGYSFAGWAVGSPTGDVYPAGASVYVSANYVLYATWEPITPITGIEISVAESEVVLYVDDSYIVQYTVTPEDAAGELVWKVEDEEVAAVIEDGMLVGLSVGSTKVTISDRSGNASVSFVVYVVEKPVPVQPENPISEETVEQINGAMDTMELTGGQIDRINEAINTNSDYLSDEAGSVIYEALLGTTINYDDPIVAEAQKELVVTVVETAVQVDAGKATSISDAQEIDKALPENANFSVEGEIDEFYQRQMYELFGGNIPTRHITRAGVPTYEINTDTDGKSGQEGADYLKDEQALYEKMVDFVDDSVDHMGKAALKLRKCSGEAVTVQVKSYVTSVKVSSFREFDKEAADKEFVEAAYKAILLSMQNEVISILEKEHQPSNNAEKEAQYEKELEAVKDIESFEIMVIEVLRQKYVALTGENIEDVDAFRPIYWEIFSAWALDKQSPYPITLEELTQTTIEQSSSRARAFTINSDLTGGEWGFIAGIAGGAALIIAASAVVPTLLKKKKAKEGNK